jgi:membrane fusion protein, multidrug efflux system
MHLTKIASLTTMASSPPKPYSAAMLRPLPITLLVCLVTAAGLGCKQEASSTVQPKPEVEVMEVVQKDVPIYSEWIGTTNGMENAKIRAQVKGFLFSRHYREGAFVKKGSLLFEIDPQKFQADLDKAKGDLARAQAQLGKTELDVQRDTPLVKAGAVSQKELDDDIQANLAARASVVAAKAVVEDAKLNLGWARITAPIDGVVGIANAQTGDLVGPDSGELTSMSTLDPIRVYFPVSEQEYLKAAGRIEAAYKESAASGREQPDDLELILSDGAVYPHKGKFFLVDRQVDVKTGTVLVAALFPNPGNVLRPGQFGRVRMMKTKPGALLVPQRAVSELQGGYEVAVVGTNNTVEIRPVKIGERLGAEWVIEEGLKPGERVVAEGLQKLKPGMTVTPKPFAMTAEEKKG